MVIILSCKDYTCLRYRIRMKSTIRLIRYINIYISQIVQYVLPTYMYSKYYMLRPKEYNNASDNFKSYIVEKFILKKQDI